VIFVSGFYDLSHHEPRRTSIEEWGRRAEWLFAHEGIRLVFFGGLNMDLKPEWSFVEPSVTFDPDEVARIDALLSRSKFHYDPTKDTARYLLLMRERYRWMYAATEIATDHAGEPFTWVDFGLPHAPEDSLTGVARRDPAPGKIRLASISHVPRYAREDLDVYYSRHWWPVGGGLWSARAPEIAWLADRIDEEWSRCLDLGFAVTDEMMLGRIVIAHPEKFDLYYADHTSLCANWNGIVRSHRLIAEMAIRAIEDGATGEGEDRLRRLGGLHKLGEWCGAR